MSFPDSESLFLQAFSADDPATRLLQLLNEHKSADYHAVCDLTIAYFDIVAKDPTLAQSLASALVAITHSPDAPIYGRETLDYVLAVQLDCTHFNYFDDDGYNEYGPTSTYLCDSLLSGLTLKFQLSAPNGSYTAILNGLEGPERSIADRFKGGPECTTEVMVVGSCIQLLLAGHAVSSKLAGSYRRSPENVAAGLKVQKERGIVKNPQAIQVLDLAISHAEKGLREEDSHDANEIWTLLFPE